MSSLVYFLIAASAMSFSSHAQQPDEKKKCSSYVLVELKLNNVWSENTPGGAFIHDSVYVGVGTDPSEAAANAIRSCLAGKYSQEKCGSATQNVMSPTESQYYDVAKGLTGCS